MRRGDESVGDRWLIDACTTEIRAHRLIFLAILGPLLAYVLPGFMFSLGFAFVVTTTASYSGYDLAKDSIWELLPWIIGFVLPIPALAIGGVREWCRLTRSDQLAQASGMRLPPVHRDQLHAILEQIWQSLSKTGSPSPKLICQPNFRIAAHAYEDRTGQAIEVTAGLAGRLLRDDPLALSILRHEVAHLVHKDLSAIRLQSLVAGAATFAADGAMAVCLCAAGLIVAYTDLGVFPMKATFSNILAVHMAILCATVIVVFPLLLGRYVVRRYSAFLVALVEMRADVCAGIWGGGLRSFSERLDSDPTVRTTTLRDRGLAYVSTALSHFPPDERIALLSNPQRLGSPKLRYFAAAIVFVWLMAFHQGSMIWDTALLATIVALLQSLTVIMVLNMGRGIRLRWLRAMVLAVGMVLTQALPFISIEGLAYLSQSLTAAPVTPDGFGGADASPLRDTIITFEEFGRFAGASVGNAGVVLALLLTTASLLAMSSIAQAFGRRIDTLRMMLIGGLTALTSVAVSYKFFQSELDEFIRLSAFRLANVDEQDADWGAIVPAFLRQPLSEAALQTSEMLKGPPFLEELAWLRVSLPVLVGLLATLLFVFLPFLFDQRKRGGPSC
ncbi:hypothetical protein BTR14_08810 [Rhizobium rhizosphaerae]|uniref:Peptidase M48 domain-containing protein n=1 Tax=Xaviernesmea rhizosphaerae TaxID=1672749 RepID=A0ABX3PE59_9HYPH|nr:hypothetical protein [Xaviernesmea rhizosphaerae]OQP86549.1 hypothetical protein BTR14_08810 [Xaviernesmea rhizosphaerae]